MMAGKVFVNEGHSRGSAVNQGMASYGFVTKGIIAQKTRCFPSIATLDKLDKRKTGGEREEYLPGVRPTAVPSCSCWPRLFPMVESHHSSHVRAGGARCGGGRKMLRRTQRIRSWRLEQRRHGTGCGSCWGIGWPSPPICWKWFSLWCWNG